LIRQQHEGFAELQVHPDRAGIAQLKAEKDHQSGETASLES